MHPAPEGEKGHDTQYLSNLGKAGRDRVNRDANLGVGDPA